MSTRERLLAAAEALYSANGIDAVSLREIQRASGVKNATALQYHFGDRAGLLSALLEKHHHDVEYRRHLLLDQFEQDAGGSVHSLAEAFVLPLAAKLADPDGGPAFLVVYADLFNRPRQMFSAEFFEDRSESAIRWRDLVDPHLDPVARRLHRRLVVTRFTVNELAQRAASGPHTDDRLFTSQLVDLVAAMIVAAPSAQTQRLDDERASQ